MQMADHPYNLNAAFVVMTGNVESLPFEDDTFDSVVSTFSLCVFDHPGKALREMARVLKGGGQMLLLEHSRSNLAPLAWYQDLTAQAVAATSKGCVWNQDLQQLLESAELRTVRSKTVLGGLVTLIEAELA